MEAVGIPDCVICQEPLCTDAIVALACGHVFHMHCVTQWLMCSPRGSCPHCRKLAARNESEVVAKGCTVDCNEPKKMSESTDEVSQCRIVGLEKQLSKLKKKLAAVTKIKDETVLEHDKLLKMYEEERDENKVIVMNLRQAEENLTEHELQKDRLRTDLRLLDKKYREAKAYVAVHNFVHKDEDESKLGKALSKLTPIRKAEIQDAAFAYTKRELMRVSRLEAESRDEVKTLQETVESFRAKLIEERDVKRVLNQKLKSLQMKLRRSEMVASAQRPEDHLAAADVDLSEFRESVYGRTERELAPAGVARDSVYATVLAAYRQQSASGLDQVSTDLPVAAPAKSPRPSAVVGPDPTSGSPTSGSVSAAVPARRPRPAAVVGPDPTSGSPTFGSISAAVPARHPRPSAVVGPDPTSGSVSAAMHARRPRPSAVVGPDHASSALSALEPLNTVSDDAEIVEDSAGENDSLNEQIVILPPLPPQAVSPPSVSQKKSITLKKWKPMPRRKRPPEFVHDRPPMILPLQGRRIGRAKMKPVGAVVGSLDKYMRRG